MEPLAESGLDQRLVDAAQDAGYEALTPLQSAAIPVLRRGGNVVLHASSGAGVVGAFGLPLLDRLVSAESTDEPAGPRAVVLTPTADRAEAVASALAQLAGATGVAVRAATAGWNLAGADVLVLTPQQALSGVQASTLKLEAVQTLVLMDLSEQFALKLDEALNTLVTFMPREGQRVITTRDVGGDVERFIEAHVRRALTVPSRPADPAMTPAPESAGQIGYVVVAEAEKSAMLARLLDGVEGDVEVVTRSSARAERLERELERRGIRAAEGASIRFAAFDGAQQGAERVVSYDVPFSADDLKRIHAGGGTVLVTPAELAHFQRTAREAPFTVKQRKARTFEKSDVDAYREMVRAALDAEDLGAQLLVLEPLFEEHSPAEVAAALSALVRSRTPQREASPSAGSAGPAPKDASSATFTRLFVSIGSRDNARPADIVGAITGEAGIKGDQVGRVDIRETFSVVEVAAAVAEKVIRALNGTTMRGRSLRVDFDRKGAGGDSGPPRGRGGPDGRSGPGGPGGRSGPGGGGPGGPRRRPPPPR